MAGVTAAPIGSSTEAASAVVDGLLKGAFLYGDPRSPEYHRGARAALERRLLGVHVRCPYTMGQSTADAFWAGVDRGNAIWLRHVEQDSAA